MNIAKNEAMLKGEELDSLEDIQQEAMAERAASYIHTFKKPFTYDGQTYTKLVFDFSKLSGEDDLAIESEMQSLGRPVVVAELSGEYQIRLAAHACTENLDVDAFAAMPLKDFRQIRNHARSFLLSAGI